MTVNGGWLDLPHSNSNVFNTHSPSGSIQGILLLQTNTLALLLHLRLHVFFGCPLFLLPFISNSSNFLKTWPSSLLNTWQYHLTPFVFAIWTTVPSIPTSPLGSLSSFSPSVLHQTLLSSLLSWSFSKLLFHFPSNIMSHSHLLLLQSKCKWFWKWQERIFFFAEMRHLIQRVRWMFITWIFFLHEHKPWPSDERLVPTILFSGLWHQKQNLVVRDQFCFYISVPFSFKIWYCGVL